MTTHGEQRLGLLTSSKASVIMSGGQRAWDSLRDMLWSAKPEDFDNKAGGARGYGHEHEDEGAAKFWDRHPEFVIQPGGFHQWQGGGPLHNWIASSPDRMLVQGKLKPKGLEIKSPTSAETFESHTLTKHYDQCQHGILVTGWPAWFLVIHHGELYSETLIKRDLAWQKEYLRRAKLFHDFCYSGREVKRRKLSVTDL